MAFGYSPLLEAVLSLHVLAEPKHHALQHGWVRGMRALPVSLRKEIAALAFLYRWTLPDCILPTATSGYDDFEAELDGSVASASTSSRSTSSGRCTTTAAASVRAPPHPLVARRARDCRSRAARLDLRRGAPSRCSSTTRELVDRFASLLEAYWRHAFAAEWARIEPQLAESVELASRQIAADGMGAFLVTLAPSSASIRRAQLRARHTDDHRVAIGPRTRCSSCPSVYVWPHVRVNCDPPWPLAVVSALRTS